MGTTFQGRTDDRYQPRLSRLFGGGTGACNFALFEQNVNTGLTKVDLQDQGTSIDI